MSSERWAVAYRSGMTSPPYELDLTADTDSDWVDDLAQDDDDSAGEDSVSIFASEFGSLDFMRIIVSLCFYLNLQFFSSAG